MAAASLTHDAPSHAPAPRIEFRSVTKRFGGGAGGVVAVSGVTFTIADGEVVSLIGPSGCGKSTLLSMGSGLYAPSEGVVLVDGEPVDGPNDHVAFMLQKDLLLPWRTIRANVEYGLEIKGIAVDERRARSLELLEKFHLAGFGDHYPHQLSGGMRQRAAMARTIAVNPTVLLMDEPFSALDAQTKMVLQQDLADTLAREGRTALFITHDLAESIALSDRVLVMSARPGRIIEEIAVDLPHRDNPMARRRLGAMAGYVDRLMELLHVGHDLEPA
ncbi:ABC transporter ATP-binding protein [Azospirillum sp. ST 5-10]|uniref:ABC transporter ATP-binding protein n=1 Tax=unclassified Azospirillum TaxID=2630922 RepID=UPI003F4A129D